MPLNQIAEWRKLARKRNLRAALFLNDGHSQWVNLLWLTLAAPLMQVHWSLFKHATWFPDRILDSTGNPAGSLLADFCRMTHKNPVLRVISDILHIMRRPAEAFHLLAYAHGNFESWSQKRRKIARRAAVTMIGQLHRKLVHPWLQYPWRLFTLADESRTEESTEARRACA